MARALLAIVAGLATLSGTGAGALAQPVPAPADRSARVDEIFQAFSTSGSPGCAVSVAEAGEVVLSREYGLANLEHAVPIGPDTIFEAGSVSKQFTAAAIGLLAHDGRLSIDDDVRKYVPEVPDFGTPVTIRHVLHHTSGLRSQWALLGLAGRPPGEVVHTTDEILDLVKRQRRLNFTPGDEYLYSNTGYTLLGVVVQRVSGKSLAAFTAERLFSPLGMTRTSWRDDHTRIVNGRATAYSKGRDGAFHTQMSFTNVHGNGGLLTTVGDLQTWNANLDSPRVGGPWLAEWLQAQGRLNDGYQIPYARGLQVVDHRGNREVSHGGATAGYRAFLARFPDERLSVALLCNTSTAPAHDLAHRVADEFLEPRSKPIEPEVPVPPDQLTPKIGLYWDQRSDALVSVALRDGRLRLGGANGDPLVPTGHGHFRIGEASARVFFEPAGAASPGRLVLDGTGFPPRTYERVARVEPTMAQLAEYAGAYRSPELDTTYAIAVRDGSLWLSHRWFEPVHLRAAIADVFEADQGRVLRFTRDHTGAVDGLSVYAGRVWHLRFDRQ